MQCVGEAADCPERDENTHEIELLPQKDISVPVLLDSEFRGEKVEIRVSDPKSGVIWAKIGLKNDIME